MHKQCFAVSITRRKTIRVRRMQMSFDPGIPTAHMRYFILRNRSCWSAGQGANGERPEPAPNTSVYLYFLGIQVSIVTHFQCKIK